MYTKGTMLLLSFLVLALGPTLASSHAMRGAFTGTTRNRILYSCSDGRDFIFTSDFTSKNGDQDHCTCTYSGYWNGQHYYDIACTGPEECAALEYTTKNATSQENTTLPSPSIISNVFSPLIVNGDFAVDMDGWYTDTWSFDPAPVFLWHELIGMNSSGGVMIQNWEPNDSRIYQVVEGLITGKQYRVTGDLKLQLYSWEEGQARECGASLSVITSFHDHSMPCINQDTNGEWQSVEMVFTASGERETIGCRLGHMASHVKGILYCDNMQIEEVIGTSNAHEDEEALVDEVFICVFPTRHYNFSNYTRYDQYFISSHQIIEQDLCIEYSQGPQRGTTVCMDTAKRDWVPGNSCSPMTINKDDVCQSCHYGSCGQPIYDCSDHPEGETFDFCEKVIPNTESPFGAFRNDGTFSFMNLQEEHDDDDSKEYTILWWSFSSKEMKRGLILGVFVIFLDIIFGIRLAFYCKRRGGCGKCYCEKKE